MSDWRTASWENSQWKDDSKDTLGEQSASWENSQWKDDSKWQEADPWQGKDPWTKGGTSVVDFSGTYKDEWDASSVTVLVQCGNEVTASFPGTQYGEEKGTISGTEIKLMSLVGQLADGVITWNNEAKWRRVEQVAHDSGGQATTNGESKGSWGADADDPAADSWGAPKEGGSEFPEQDEAQKARRWKEFQEWQDYNKENGILPVKSEEEILQDEERLFKVSEGHGAGMDFNLYDQVQCEVTGPKTENIPQLKTFEELYTTFNDQIPPELRDNVRRCGYERPTPVQKFAIPAALSGRDVMCCAQTGSGKTAAFLVPILSSMLKHHSGAGSSETPFEGPCQPDTLVLSPTRELCLQIYDEALKFCFRTKFRIIRIYGQEPVKVQVEQVAKGADLVIATPGRMWDFASSGIIDLSKLNCFVIDEADRMIAKGMEWWIKEIVNSFNMPSKDERQTLMFSATFPEEIQKLAVDYLYEYVWVGVGVIGGAASTVAQKLQKVENTDAAKLEKLVDLLYDFYQHRKPHERLIIFTNSKVRAKGLDELLYEKNFDVGALHGDLTQPEREASLQKFRDGRCEILIATDLASRGLDIDGVSHVVNYDLPRERDGYVQRIGRTGRIGHRGLAVSFIAVDSNGQFTDEPEVLQALPNLMADANSDVPDWLTKHLEEFNSATWATPQNYENQWQDWRTNNPDQSEQEHQQQQQPPEWQ